MKQQALIKVLSFNEDVTKEEELCSKQQRTTDIRDFY